ncbi:MAG: serine/threonine protein kinase, partial [Pirellulales bacterium]|nr:serine/threonine protein kinase [Pirellulales bacterium]
QFLSHRFSSGSTKPLHCWVAMNTPSEDPQPQPEADSGWETPDDSSPTAQQDGEESASPSKETGDTAAAQPPSDVVCPRCDRVLPPDSPNQLCPYCLLEAAAVGPTSLLTRVQRPANPKAPEPSDLQPFFAALEIRSLLGIGGMGAVYRAHQPSLGRDVALKILLPEVAAAEGFTERFLREARALARLGHPNVVTVFDHGTAGPYAYLVMELVEGINLRELMAGDRLPPEETLRIVPQLCDALQFAHARGVVHRDIKPENILIEDNGRVKITDFGLAKLGEGEEQFGRTGTRQVMGTIHYMAPEQIERPREVDHRADLYSLGVVFYELLTGELPLGRFCPPSEKAGTGRKLDHVVLKSLEKEPDRRYSSAEEVRSDLDREPPVSEHARAAAAAVNEKIKQTAGAVRSVASSVGDPSWTSICMLVATAAFYLLTIVSFFAVLASHSPLLPIIVFTISVWCAAYVLDRLYRSVPLPSKLSAIGAPVTWIKQVGQRVFEWIVDGAVRLKGGDGSAGP